MKRELRMTHFFNKKETEILIGVFPELNNFVTDIDGKHLEIEDEYLPIENFVEISGKGYQAELRGKKYKIGSASFTSQQSKSLETAVYIQRDEDFLGKFIFMEEVWTRDFS